MLQFSGARWAVLLRATGYPLLFLALFSIAGGHWAVLQTVAWTGMMIEYSRESPLTMAIKKTFSGQAPCDMCHSIEAGKQKESRQPLVWKADKKLDKFFPVTALCAPLPAATDFQFPPLTDESGARRASAPPSPVPIAA